MVAPAAALLAIALVLIAAGSTPGEAIGALLSGSLGSYNGRMEVLVRTCPLLFAGLGVGLAFKAGVWNIGAEGQIYAGALAAMAAAPVCKGLPALAGITLLLATSFAAGGCWAWIAAVLRTRRSVPEVISTIMLNFLAIQTTGWALHGWLRESSGQFPYSDPLPASLMLARLAPPTLLHLGVVFSFAAAGICWVLLFRTVWGFHVRTTGASVLAAEHAGVRVERVIWQAMLASGGLAGLAGAIEVMGVTGRLYENFSPGYGYTAVAVALLGGLHPAGIAAAALAFGLLQAGAGALQSEAGISSVFVYLVQGVIVLTVAVQAAHRVRERSAMLARGAEEV